MFWAGVLILLAVTALALYATFRPEERTLGRPRLLLIGGGLIFPMTVLTALLFYGVRTGHALLPLPGRPDVFHVEVVAHQWWWEVIYPDVGGRPLYAANEIHIPAGRPVDVTVRSADVIHSFWAPRLGGKIDAIPGHSNRIRLQADLPGIYWGQCAEFCGAQHARMGLVIEAHEEPALQERLARLAAAGPAPAEARGAAAFQTFCAGCHSIDARVRGTGFGPNLAGLATRRMLGAGVLANGRESLETWLVAHQVLKPGNRMPTLPILEPAERAALLRYLEPSR